MYSGMMEEIIIPIHKQMAQLNIGKSLFDPPEVMCEFEKPPSTQKPEMDRPRTSETRQITPLNGFHGGFADVALTWWWAPQVSPPSLLSSLLLWSAADASLVPP